MPRILQILKNAKVAVNIRKYTCVRAPAGAGVCAGGRGRVRRRACGRAGAGVRVQACGRGFVGGCVGGRGRVFGVFSWRQRKKRILFAYVRCCFSTCCTSVPVFLMRI